MGSSLLLNSSDAHWSMIAGSLVRRPAHPGRMAASMRTVQTRDVIHFLFMKAPWMRSLDGRGEQRHQGMTLSRSVRLIPHDAGECKQIVAVSAHSLNRCLNVRQGGSPL